MAIRDRNSLEVPAATGKANFDQRVSTSLGALRGALPNMGRSVLDFGKFPGASDAQVVIADQRGIVESSIVQAWILPVATVDHSVDEHRIEPIRLLAGAIVPGVGFSIFGNYAGAGDALVYGQWTVAWMWS